MCCLLFLFLYKVMKFWMDSSKLMTELVGTVSGTTCDVCFGCVGVGVKCGGVMCDVEGEYGV